MNPFAAGAIVVFFLWLFFDIATATVHEEQEEMEPEPDVTEDFYSK